MENPNSRLEAFCDGVFAIALTLLIIEIKVPSTEAVHTKAELWDAFARQWPSWLAFFISFITILISWVNHSHAFRLINKSSPQFTYANGLLLLSVILIPFPTVAVAEYINTDLAQPACTLYCAVALLNNIAWNVMQYTTHHPESLLKPNVNPGVIKKGADYTRVGFVIYALAFLLSFWFPVIAFMFVGFTYVLWLVVGISLKEEKATV